MRLAHLALWTKDVEQAAAFWSAFFDAEIGDRYESRNRIGFVSRFVTLRESGLQLELMQGPWVETPAGRETVGWAHIALSVRGKEAVDTTARRFELAGLLVSAPRMTGDGYYEALVNTPEGILIEIVA
ncbi:MAG: glyoxalase/bleomycin resistance/extradiol dioxygenase family protein [Mesorhizobium sp.]|uniref:VOC family protein n=1 Tax=unclassified Mesorhizobium TaxID=325217 RepID=UPI000FCABBF5|nr:MULTISPECIES: VOC family protein [unclassified Mesorhizobium]RUV96949.1 glyoxalase/bleomycin resistance/extradiol dioxygenase family protein [Mesorhizobium sp. M5C.F.Ca.IN.020.14.1.1]RUV23491.1 glyoxalase/bleomycin resistance/extradiol dioxygenase family protein [Mesorhizobium sp. M5C.F.Ca.IN.020.32.2.1]RUV63612.1 glyoxalase/bleomycin resistance/extradiol dioxygenase family protein [Mesorhizobium sp. M5C.F.Ca.IN.020.29.1.1]RWD51870.1 MAG: glyoxalase/bleomycin resistance/extradiol dioxygenase